MHRVLPAELAVLVQLKARLEFLYVLLGFMRDVLAHRAFQVDKIVLRHTSLVNSF